MEIKDQHPGFVPEGFSLIRAAELRALARERGYALDVIQKDYMLGWILVGIVRSRFGSKLVLKGGTALSKVYFPSGWRLSEDLDFTFDELSGLEQEIKLFAEEIPPSVAKASAGLRVRIPDPPHTANGEYFQLRVQYEGVIGGGTAKVEASREELIGPTTIRGLARSYPDYPAQRLKVYTIENIISEKLRSMVQRHRIRDYYDVWKLIRVGNVDWGAVRQLLPGKCAFKGVRISSVKDLFPDGLEEILAPYQRRGLTRLTKEDLPPLNVLLAELKEVIKRETRGLFPFRVK